MARTLAIIPARSGSKRLPGKNLALLNGVPLITRTVRFAVACGLFDRILVSSDDPQIVKTAVDAGATAYGLRPAALASDTAGTTDVLIHELNMAEKADGPFDQVALLQPTTPFRRRERWDEAMKMMDADSGIPSVIGVSPATELPWHMFVLGADNRLKPIFSDMLTQRSQDLPPAAVVNGSLYLVQSAVMRQTGRLFHDSSRGVICDTPEEQIDIDTALDFAHAEALLIALEGRA